MGETTVPSTGDDRRISEPSVSGTPSWEVPLFEDDGFSGQKRPFGGIGFFPSFPEVAQPVEAVSQIKWGTPTNLWEVAVAIAGSLGKKN